MKINSLDANIYEALDVNAQCLFARIDGCLNIDNCFELAQAIRINPEYQNHFNTVTWLTNCQIDLDFNDLGRLKSYIDKTWPSKHELNAAFVVDSALSHGLTRVYEQQATTRNVLPQIFHPDEPNFKKHLTEFMRLPAGYSFPDFFDFPQ